MPEEPTPTVKKRICPECKKECDADLSRCDKCDFPFYMEQFEADRERVRKLRNPEPPKKKPARTPLDGFFGGR